MSIMKERVITITIEKTGAVQCKYAGAITKRELLRVQRILKAGYRQAKIEYLQNQRLKENGNARTEQAKPKTRQDLGRPEQDTSSSGTTESPPRQAEVNRPTEPSSTGPSNSESSLSNSTGEGSQIRRGQTGNQTGNQIYEANVG